MKCMIAFSCLLAVASAGYVNNAVAYSGALGYANVGTPAVAYNAPLVSANYGSKAVAYNAPLVSAPHPIPVGPYVGPLAHGYAGAIAAPALAYSGYAQAAPLNYGYGIGAGLVSEARLVDPIAIAAGAPLPTGDTVEVAAAKAAHYQAHAVEKSRAYAGPIVSGVAGYGYGIGAGLVSEARLVDPIAIAAGAPLPTGDTVEVAAAKALHYQAHAAAKGHYVVKRSPGYVNAYSGIGSSLGYSGYGSPLAYSGYSGYSGLGYGGLVGSYYG